MRSRGRLKRINRRRSASCEPDRDEVDDDDTEEFEWFWRLELGARVVLYDGMLGPKTLVSKDLSDCGLVIGGYCGMRRDDVDKDGTMGYEA